MSVLTRFSKLSPMLSLSCIDILLCAVVGAARAEGETMLDVPCSGLGWVSYIATEPRVPRLLLPVDANTMCAAL